MPELALNRIYKLVGELNQDEKLKLVAYVWGQLTEDQRTEFCLIEFMIRQGETS